MQKAIIKLAYDELKKSEYVGIDEIVDIGDRVVFWGKSKEMDYSNTPIVIDKVTLVIKPFFEYETTNFDLVENGTHINVPDEYKK